MSMAGSARRGLRRIWNAPALDWWIVALIAAAAYPTIFALSKNWYALSSAKIVWLLAVVALALPLAVYALIALLGYVMRSVSPAGKWPRIVQAVLVALSCSVFLFVLFGGTLLDLLESDAAIAVLFAVVAAGVAWLFLRDGQRYFSSILLALTFIAGLSWIASYASYQLSPLAREARAEAHDFSRVKLVDRPNIYFFIYDAYGSREAYRRVHGFDNERQYAELEADGFKVVHTFSNYIATWPTTLSTFLGYHHYYRLNTGVSDSKFGRSIMAGKYYNPVLQVLRRNGYRIQYVHHNDYFVKERGVLDFNFPDEPANNALAVFGNPWLNRMFGLAGDRAAAISNAEQMEVLLSRIMPPAEKTGEPWFTFAHVDLPAHSPTGVDWQGLGGFSEVYKRRTVKANEHMSAVISAIEDRDKSAIIAIIGDHGSWRYRDVWGEKGDPNAAMLAAGVDPTTVTLDIFGIMIAIDSGGKCDGYVYLGLTPVNVMRAIFACLSRNPSLLDARAPDISLIRPWKPKFWVTARDGKPLPRWEPYQKAQD